MTLTRKDKINKWAWIAAVGGGLGIATWLIANVGYPVMAGKFATRPEIRKVKSDVSDLGTRTTKLEVRIDGIDKAIAAKLDAIFKKLP